MKDLEGFKERYALNSRVVKKDGKLIEEVYRVGGRYDKEIRSIVQHLEAAIPFATPTMKEALNALAQWYRTGENADRVAYDVAWVQDKDSPVDTINGFIEVYMDSRGHKGSWEALVYFVNPEKTAGDQEDRRQRPVVRGPDALGRSIPEAGRPRHHRQRHRRGDRNRRLGTDHADRHQPAERSGDPREARQQVGVAVEREHRLRQVDVGIVPPRVRVDRGGGAARREVEQRGERADDQHARGDRSRVREDLREAEGQPADGVEGAVLRARGGACRSGRAVFHSQPEARRAGDHRGQGPGRDRPRRVPRAIPGTRWRSCGGSAKAPRSRKTTCATAR